MGNWVWHLQTRFREGLRAGWRSDINLRLSLKPSVTEGPTNHAKLSKGLSKMVLLSVGKGPSVKDTQRLPDKL